jgi:hypothetical protein
MVASETFDRIAAKVFFISGPAFACGGVRSNRGLSLNGSS